MKTFEGTFLSKIPNELRLFNGNVLCARELLPLLDWLVLCAPSRKLKKLARISKTSLWYLLIESMELIFWYKIVRCIKYWQSNLGLFFLLLNLGLNMISNFLISSLINTHPCSSPSLQNVLRDNILLSSRSGNPMAVDTSYNVPCSCQSVFVDSIW